MENKMPNDLELKEKKMEKKNNRFLKNWLPQSFNILLMIIFIAAIFESIALFIFGNYLNASYYKWISILDTLFNLTCFIGAFALFFYKKWGFWLLVNGIFLESIFNRIVFHLNMQQILYGFLILIVLYILLKLKGKKSMWNQLK